MTGRIIERDEALQLLPALTELVARAGLAILAIARDALDVAGKSDGSPVTAADLAADAVLLEGLSRLAPGVTVVSEERSSHGATGTACHFLVDPLDGTKEFIAGRDEYTVNLALVRDGRPLLGIVGAPAQGVIWRGVVGAGAEQVSLDSTGGVRARRPIHTRALPAGQWIAAVSRSHGDARTEAFIAARPGAERRTMGSAVKFARIAEGGADIYPRLSPTCEWDVGAGHALVEAAGGKVTGADGRPLVFGVAADHIVPAFIAWGDPGAAAAPAAAPRDDG